jgi:RNA polymerase sigma-70 factor (ECF subfamily)
VGRERLDFAEFYERSWGPCLKAVLATQASAQMAEDQLAEAFARAWASWWTVRRHPAPRAWVVRTALNVGVSWWRHQRREVALGGQEGSHDTDIGTGGVDDGLLKALRRLPLREREVVVLRLVLDLDTATTARQLGIAPGTVRAHLARAMAALRLQVVPDDPMEATKCTTATS